MVKKYGNCSGNWLVVPLLVIVALYLTGCASMFNAEESASMPEASVEEEIAAEPETAVELSDDDSESAGDRVDTPAGSSAESAPLVSSADPKELRKDALEESPVATVTGESSDLRGSDSASSVGPEFVYAEPTVDSGLSAGFTNDNEQYGYFLDFLEEYRWADHLPLDISERIILRLQDARGDSVPNATIAISARGAESDVPVETGRTHADGTYQFNPSLYSNAILEYVASIEGTAGTTLVSFPRSGERSVTVDFQDYRDLPQTIPVDIVFILDTTGSMGEEIDRLKRTIELIHLNLTSMPLPITLRFGLVLYKDIGDAYRTNIVALTSNLQEFQKRLNGVRASGGGDTPEDLQAALEQAVESFDWNEDGIRMSFVVTDAPPHLDYGQIYDYTVASRDARRKGIKIFCVGTGGLDIDGEYVLRQIAQFTGGVYIFLTYGESGESEGGAPGSVSHHSGSNFQTDKLESIIIRLAKEELSFLTSEPMKTPESFFTARKLDSEERERTLASLFAQSVEQLADFSTIAISKSSAIAVLPISTNADEITVDAEYFTEQLILAASRSSRISLVERRNLQELLEEQKIQLSGLTDSETVTKIGEIMNAEMLVLGVLYAGDSYELFLKLIRVETGEVLSVTKSIIDRALGVTDDRT